MQGVSTTKVFVSYKLKTLKRLAFVNYCPATYVFARESITPLICSIAMSLYDIIERMSLRLSYSIVQVKSNRKDDFSTFRPRSSPVLSGSRRLAGSAVGNLIRQLENKIVSTGDTTLPRPSVDYYGSMTRSGSIGEARQNSFQAKSVGQRGMSSSQDTSSSSNNSPSDSPNFQLKRKVSARSKISNTLGQVMRKSSITSIGSSGTESASDRRESSVGPEEVSSGKPDTASQKSLGPESPIKMESDPSKPLPTSSADSDSVFIPGPLKPTPRSATVSTPAVGSATPPARLDLLTPQFSHSSTASTPSTSEVGSIPRTDSEVHRKKTARKERKQRKVTQGVSQEVFKKIMEGDLSAEDAIEMMNAGESAGESPMIARKADISLNSSARSNGSEAPQGDCAGNGNTPYPLEKGDTVKKAQEQSDVPSTPTGEEATSATKPKDGFVMSAFKPLTRPPSKMLIDMPQDAQVSFDCLSCT